MVYDSGMNTWKRGQSIVVKDVNGSFLLRRLWGVVEHGVYILSEKEWKKAEAGLPHLEPVGFPMEDAFAYTAENKGVQIPSEFVPDFDRKAMTPFRNTLFPQTYPQN